MTDLPWRTSSYSTPGSNCVEVARTGGAVLVRNSIHPDAGTLRLAGGEAAAWIEGFRSGQFDDLTE